MMDQWKNAKDAPALLRADRTLAFAFDQTKVGHIELLAQARIALANDKFDHARELFSKAQEMDPNDPEAKAGLKIAEQIIAGKIKKDNLLAMAGVKDEVAQQPPAGQPGAKEDDMINRVDQHRKIEEQRLQLQVQETIKQAKRELQENSEEAIRRLKVMQDTMRLNPDVTEDLRRKLSQQLENETCARPRSRPRGSRRPGLRARSSSPRPGPRTTFFASTISASSRCARPWRSTRT